jgi:hypothetical protein
MILNSKADKGCLGTREIERERNRMSKGKGKNLK